jgi:hypothetical protein
MEKQSVQRSIEHMEIPLAVIHAINRAMREQHQIFTLFGNEIRNIILDAETHEIYVRYASGTVFQIDGRIMQCLIVQFREEWKG